MFRAPGSSCPSRGYRWSPLRRRSHICRAGIWGWWHPPLSASALLFLPCVSPTPVACRPSRRQAIGLGRGAAEQRGLLGGRTTRGDALERVPHHRIAAHSLVDRKIALEHRALRSEGLDADLNIGPPGLFEILRGGRHLVIEKCEA